MNVDKISITFDENNRIRVLDADKYQETEKMKTGCNEFIKKVLDFDEMVITLVDVLNSQSNLIEEEKLKAVGARNRVEGEAEARKRKQQELNTLINEKMNELERFSLQHESLGKVESEQRQLIERLSNNEA